MLPVLSDRLCSPFTCDYGLYDLTGTKQASPREKTQVAGLQDHLANNHVFLLM